MDSSHHDARRCVIWFGKPSAREKKMLASTGWELRVADPRRSASVGMRGGDKVVALLDLRDLTAEGVQALEEDDQAWRKKALYDD